MKPIKEYKQASDNRWYAGEPTILGPGDKVADTVIRQAKDEGSRVTREGGSVVRWAKTGTSAGVCMALASYWIIRSARGDFWDWLGPGSKACPSAPNVNPKAGETVAKIQAAMRRQKEVIADKQYANLDGGFGNFVAADEIIRAEAGLSQRELVMVNDWPPDDENGWLYISISGTTWANKPFNHALGAKTTKGGEAILFDPNFGEAGTKDTKELSDFVKFMCKEKKWYHLKKYRIGYMAFA